MAKEKAESIGKAELVDTLKEKTGLAKKDIDEVISAFASAVREEVLVGGKEIRLRDFGTFKRKVTAARVGRNPRTGEELQISSAKSVSFSVSSSLKVKDASAPAKKAKK
jgi:DNA-binding protein HU-beta